MGKASYSDFHENKTEPIVGDVYATRIFTLQRNDAGEVELVGFTYRQPILPGVNQAQCGLEDGYHAAPAPGCTCGWYAYDEERRWSDDPVYVEAIVRLSGKIVVCERGLKAAELEVVALAHGAAAAEGELLREYLKANRQIEEFPTSQAMLSAYPLSRMQRTPQRGAGLRSFWEALRSAGESSLGLWILALLAVGFGGVSFSPMFAPPNAFSWVGVFVFVGALAFNQWLQERVLKTALRGRKLIAFALACINFWIAIRCTLYILPATYEDHPVAVERYTFDLNNILSGFVFLLPLILFTVAFYRFFDLVGIVSSSSVNAPQTIKLAPLRRGESKEAPPLSEDEEWYYGLLEEQNPDETADDSTEAAGR